MRILEIRYRKTKRGWNWCLIHFPLLRGKIALLIHQCFVICWFERVIKLFLQSLFKFLPLVRHYTPCHCCNLMLTFYKLPLPSATINLLNTFGSTGYQTSPSQKSLWPTTIIYQSTKDPILINYFPTMVTIRTTNGLIMNFKKVKWLKSKQTK